MKEISFSTRVHQELFASQKGQELWRFVNEPMSVKCMKVASALGKPAVLGLEEDLLETMGFKKRDDLEGDSKVDYDRSKQMLGQMVRQVMEFHGYRLKASNVKTPSSEIFYSASTYQKG